jgi:hypothetical protein
MTQKKVTQEVDRACCGRCALRVSCPAAWVPAAHRLSTFRRPLRGWHRSLDTSMVVVHQSFESIGAHTLSREVARVDSMHRSHPRVQPIP